MLFFIFPENWTSGPNLNMKRVFGHIAYLPDTICNENKLFLLGGVDPTTLEPVMETEAYDEEKEVWVIHKSVPMIENHVLQNNADSGCISTIHGVIYSVGKDIIALDWTTLEVTFVTRLKKSAESEGCVYIQMKNEDFGFFFLSGDWFSLKYRSWSVFARPDPAFNIANFGNIPSILGMANMNRTCKDRNTNCGEKILFGDRRVLQLDIEENSWEVVGSLKYPRLGYSSFLQLPQNVCEILEPSYIESVQHLLSNVAEVNDDPIAIIEEERQTMQLYISYRIRSDLIENSTFKFVVNEYSDQLQMSISFQLIILTLIRNNIQFKFLPNLIKNFCPNLNMIF